MPTTLYNRAFDGMVTHIVINDPMNLDRVTLTGFINGSQVEVKLVNGKTRFINLQSILK